MCCNAPLATGPQLYTSGSSALHYRNEITPLDTVNAFSTRRRPISESIIELTNAFVANQGHSRLNQFVVIEEATASSNLKSHPLRFLLYRTTAPTAPTLNADYTVSTTNLAGVVKVTAADYEYLDEGKVRATLTYDQLTANNSDVTFVGGTGSSGTSLFVVALYDSGTSGGVYHSSGKLYITPTWEYMA